MNILLSSSQQFTVTYFQGQGNFHDDTQQSDVTRPFSPPDCFLWSFPSYVKMFIPGPLWVCSFFLTPDFLLLQIAEEDLSYKIKKIFLPDHDQNDQHFTVE